jgi:hypothetical protein
VNVGFASLQMNKAVGIDPKTYGLGAGIFFIGYFLLEVPSDLALQRFGARTWIARIMLTWGAVSPLALMPVRDRSGPSHRNGSVQRLPPRTSPKSMHSAICRAFSSTLNRLDQA